MSGTSWTYALLYRFPKKCKCDPIIAATDSSGSLYGYTNLRHLNVGSTVFKFTPATGKLKTLYTFPTTAPLSPAGNLVSSLTIGSKGALYGTTARGGSDNFGTAFEYNTKGTGSPTVLFNSVETSYFAPSPLVSDGLGNLFGTIGDSPNQEDAVFEWNIASAAFTFVTDMTSAQAAGSNNGVVFDSSGNLWGSSPTGGGINQVGVGTLFGFNVASRTPSVVHTFALSPDGGDPTPVVMGPANTFYGIVQTGTNAVAHGTLFTYATATNTFTTAYAFSATDVAGGDPGGPIAVDSSGAAYGSFQFGRNKTGTAVVFKIVP